MNAESGSWYKSKAHTSEEVWSNLGANVCERNVRIGEVDLLEASLDHVMP